MDTKSKNNNTNLAAPGSFKRQWPILLVSVLICAAISIGFLSYGWMAFSTTEPSYTMVFHDSNFADELYQDSQMLYWKLQQKESDNFTLTPGDVFLSSRVSEDFVSQHFGIERDDYANEEDYQAALQERQLDLESDLSNTKQLLQNYMNQRSYTFDEKWANTGYLVLDLENGQYIGTWNDDMAALARGIADSEALNRLQQANAYYAVLRFNENGTLGVPTVFGASQSSMDSLRSIHFSDFLFAYDDTLYDLAENSSYLQPPRNMAVVFPIPHSHISQFYSGVSNSDSFEMQRIGIPFLYLLSLLLACGGGVLLWQHPKSNLRKSPLAKMPPEVSLLIIMSSIGLYPESLDYSLLRLFNGEYADALIRRTFIPTNLSNAAAYSFFAVMLTGILLACLWAAASVMQIKRLGFGGYIQQRSFCLWFWDKFSTPIKAAWHWVTDIDLSDKSNAAILKILVANFLVLALLCSIWLYGILGLIVYSIILFFVLQNYANKLKQNYARLLDATGQMAQGRLDVSIDKDLGVFTPLGQELEKVQQGFTVAVREQTKSQRMKTELISNVSHDLKTPLTAIITYVNLLKQEDLTDEERRSYVATLDQKSQRLKHLIEDLFEMSKASSGNIALHPTKVDLPALVRQVELEAQDALEEANIEFRYNFPPGKVELLLDGEKTSRIFENLIMNVAKYGMPGTRAYVTIVAGEKLVTLEMKNISKNELTFDAGEITERFMRGDASRSTNGSGLGLAIAKSFVEAQGGQFKIVTDGDMFKAYITFSRVPGVAVPRSTPAQPQQTGIPGDNTAGFTAPSSAYKPPAAAFAQEQVPPAQGSYPPPYNSGHPYYQNPGQQQTGMGGSLGQMTFNQMADSAVNIANQAVNAVASAARQVADKAKQATLTAKEEQQAAKKTLQIAKQEAKEAARRLRKEARQVRKGFTPPYTPPYGNPPYPNWQGNPPYPPTAPQADTAPYPSQAPTHPPFYAPSYTPAPNPEPAPAEVLHPEKLFDGIPTPAVAPRPELTLHTGNGFDMPAVPQPNLSFDYQGVPHWQDAAEPELTLTPKPLPEQPYADEAPDQTPQEPHPADGTGHEAQPLSNPPDSGLAPKLELYPAPELFFPQEEQTIPQPPPQEDDASPLL